MAETHAINGTPLTCTPKRLPLNMMAGAARIATDINPLNHAPIERMLRVDKDFPITPARAAILVTKFWHTNGVHLTVGFLDDAEPELRRRIIEHMNAWDKTANVKFTEGGKDAQVRIARLGGQAGGYWSYLGTDILSISPGEPTMNLEGFTMDTPESEFHRVVRHETGHTMGFPHEHMRRTLVKKIDPKKAIAFFGETQGWTPEEVRAQVLTPIEDAALVKTAFADPKSIMCYQIPGSITKNGKPIVGGLDIDASDFRFAGKVYPKEGTSIVDLPKPKTFHSSLQKIKARPTAKKKPKARR